MKPASRTKWLLAIALAVVAFHSGGCTNHNPKPYGEEGQLFLPGDHGVVWAIAPTVNISGVRSVDPLISSDTVFGQLQQVHGLTVIPVDRVAEVYAALKIDKVESPAQAYEVCDLLGADALLIPTVTAYDPYDPPKMGASLQLFLKPGSYKGNPPLDVHELDRSPTFTETASMAPTQLIQAVGMFDAADGTVRDRVNAYASGRYDPNGPFGPKEFFVSMDRYTEFVYHELINQLLGSLPQT